MNYSCTTRISGISITVFGQFFDFLERDPDCWCDLHTKCDCADQVNSWLYCQVNPYYVGARFWYIYGCSILCTGLFQ